MDGMNTNRVVTALSKDKLAVADFIFQNNPNGVLSSLRYHNLTSLTTPDKAQISKLFKRMIYRQDFTELRTILSLIPYNEQAANRSTDPELWTAMGLEQGDIAGLVAKYI